MLGSKQALRHVRVQNKTNSCGQKRKKQCSVRAACNTFSDVIILTIILAKTNVLVLVILTTEVSRAILHPVRNVRDAVRNELRKV